MSIYDRRKREAERERLRMERQTLLALIFVTGLFTVWGFLTWAL